MKTIDRILKEAGYTKRQLLDCEISEVCNGMGGKGGIQWTDKLRKLKYFKEKKKKDLLVNIDYVSDIHDIDFNNGGSVITFIKANYNLAVRVLTLIHWTTFTGRLTMFCLVFFGTTFFGWKYFNFN